MNPVPEFWEIKLNKYSVRFDNRDVRQRLTDLGFRLMSCDTNVVRVAHYKPSTIMLWMMKDVELINELDVKISKYYYNS